MIQGKQSFIDVDYFIWTKLMELSEDDILRLLEEEFIIGREGFFCLKSSKNLTHTKALLTYRKRTRMKIFNSLKTKIEIKPLRLWTDNSIYRARFIGFIPPVFISLIRFEIPELKYTSTKFIKMALSNLTVTIDSWMGK